MEKVPRPPTLCQADLCPGLEATQQPRFASRLSCVEEEAPALPQDTGLRVAALPQPSALLKQHLQTTHSPILQKKAITKVIY